jgi:hypothetical protein
MIDPGKDNEPKSREDEIGADISHNKNIDNHFIDGIKTGNEKRKRYFDKPFDEQMYDSFDELRENQNTLPKDEEGD